MWLGQPAAWRPGPLADKGAGAGPRVTCPAPAPSWPAGAPPPHEARAPQAATGPPSCPRAARRRARREPERQPGPGRAECSVPRPPLLSHFSWEPRAALSYWRELAARRRLQHARTRAGLRGLRGSYPRPLGGGGDRDSPWGGGGRRGGRKKTRQEDRGGGREACHLQPPRERPRCTHLD